MSNQLPTTQRQIDADFISASQLLQFVPCSRGSLYTWAKCGAFPTPINFGCRKLRWRRSDVSKWLTDRGLAPLPSPESVQ